MKRGNHRSNLLSNGFSKFSLKKAIVKGLSLSICAFMLSSCGGNSGYREYLDNYVALQTEAANQAHAMNPGISVYVDFSDGMNAAYGTEVSQGALKSVINVFTGANEQASFFSLANDEITPLDLPQTGIYNAVMSPKNYTKPKAPIEKTLNEIVTKKQPALLITDFEEYNGGVIQKQNYAKDYFINWLTMGYNITFYKLDYKEGAKPKKLYFTVFDSPENALGTEVEKAISSYLTQGFEKFVLGGVCTSFDIHTSYPSSTQGGNYHASNGTDIVSGVLEDGKEEAYKNYTTSVYEPFTEYYPLGEKWQGIVSNIASTQEEGYPAEDRFAHLLSKVYANFTLQNGYDIKSVAALVTDFEPAMQKIMVVRDSLTQEGQTFTLPTELPNGTQVLDMFTASMAPAEGVNLPGNGWNEIFVDFDTRFKGNIPASMTAETDLLKVDVVIAEATPASDATIEEFFAWPGNNSLSESVKNTLNSQKVNPKGRPIITYFLKVL